MHDLIILKKKKISTGLLHKLEAAKCSFVPAALRRLWCMRRKVTDLTHWDSGNDLPSFGGKKKKVCMCVCVFVCVYVWEGERERERRGDSHRVLLFWAESCWFPSRKYEEKHSFVSLCCIYNNEIITIFIPANRSVLLASTLSHGRREQTST